jgi:hypothetical protein
MTHPHDVVVLADVDRTLRNSDRLKRGLRRHLEPVLRRRAVRGLLGDCRGPCGAS